MKEAERKPNNLTNLPQPPYARGGDIFMEGKPDMPPNSQPTNPERAERQAEINRALEMLRKRTDIPTDMRRGIEDMLGKGKLPPGGGAPEPGEPGEPASGAGIPPGGPPTSPPVTPPEEPNGQEREPAIRDRKAAELIAKFRQEGGEGNKEKTQQLRNDLSQRIEELMREQWELGDSDEAKTPEGKARIDVQIDELNERISQIQQLLTEGVQERGRRGDPDALRLADETKEFVDGLLGRGLKISEINDLAKLTPRERARRFLLIGEIKRFIENSPSLESSSFPSEILLAVRHFRELREQLISDIMFKSFEDRSETNEYEVNLYADSNLNTLLGFMNKDDNERYRYFFSLRTATRFFQSMNATVLKGTFDSFGHSAENINYQHFENMRDIRGSGLAMRLYEQAYRDILASDKRVTQDKIAGIKEFVETTFKEINEAGLIMSEYAQYRTDSKMENWEVQRALAAGRSFFNITLRAAENIAIGQVPIDDRRRYTSPPQEDMVRILNWNQWLLTRFTLGGDEKGRHGKEFLERSTERWEEFLRYKGAKLDINRIIEFGGVDVRKMEEGGQYRTSGVYSGWRLENMAFDEIYLKDLKGKDGRALRDEKRRIPTPGETVLRDEDGRAFVSVQSFMDNELIPEDLLKRLKKRKIIGEQVVSMTVLKAVKAFDDDIKKRAQRSPNENPGELVTPDDQQDYMNILKSVVDNLDFGLSMLLKNGDFGAQDNKLGYLLRTKIWEKIASTNTPLMIDYLTDIKYADNTPEPKKAKSIKTLRSEIVPGWSEEQWKDFKNKVLVRFERTIRKGMGEQLPPVTAEYELNAEEKKLEDEIKIQGQKLAPYLADIIFAYTPFMNDMPFEKFQYKYAGQTFYKRRTTGDLGGFNKGQQAYTKILSNPGGLPVKEVVAAMGEIVSGIESPEGPRLAMETNFPTFSALLDVVITESGKRQAILKMLLEATRKETSLAQKWAGIKADSFTESEAATLIDDATRAGILNPELARYLKKNKHLMLSAILWMLFRDVFVMVPIFAGAELIGKLTKEK